MVEYFDVGEAGELAFSQEAKNFGQLLAAELEKNLAYRVFVEPKNQNAAV